MSEQGSFWAKLRAALFGKPTDQGERAPIKTDAPPSASASEKSPAETSSPSPAMPPLPDKAREPIYVKTPPERSLNKKEPTLSQIKEGYTKVLHMMEKMELYFETNEKRALFLSKSVERFADTLDRLADVQKTHGDSIEAIAKSAEENGHLTRQMGAALQEMPASLSQLSETLEAIMDRVVNNQDRLVEKVSDNQVTLLKQVDAVRETHSSFSTALNQFGSAVDELAASSRSNAETFKRIGITEMEQRSGLTKIVTKHTRRFTVLVSVMGTIALGALATIISLMIMLMQRPGLVPGTG